jgi:hypothetical protein
VGTETHERFVADVHEVQSYASFARALTLAVLVTAYLLKGSLVSAQRYVWTNVWSGDGYVYDQSTKMAI